ncbi:hypothetical protein SUGI_0078860 [Cryptomeria japonica]|nr:hypothetical protein SUGI_0078860 [Cryptomeria japonica]
MNQRGSYLSDDEENIKTLNRLMENRWSSIESRTPGRADNEIKNNWSTHLSKKVAKKDTKCTNQCYIRCFGQATHLQHSSDQNEQVYSEPERGRSLMDNILSINEYMGSAESSGHSLFAVKDQTSFLYEEIQSFLVEYIFQLGNCKLQTAQWMWRSCST